MPNQPRDNPDSELRAGEPKEGVLQPEDVYFDLPVCDVTGALEFLRFLREEDDAEEQRETFEYLQRVLDQDRFSETPVCGATLSETINH